MNLIAAVDSNWAIGYNGELLERIPEDLKYFKEMTSGKIVVTGRKTLYTFPEKKPLVGRTNIILTRNKEFTCEGAIIYHSTEELLSNLKNYKSEDVFVIGGEDIYSQLIKYCEYAYITKIHSEHTADKFISNFDNLEGWEIQEERKVKHYKEIDFQFISYKNLMTERY